MHLASITLDLLLMLDYSTLTCSNYINESLLFLRKGLPLLSLVFIIFLYSQPDEIVVSHVDKWK